MERNKAIVGRWAGRIRERHVERDRFHHKLTLRCYGGPEDRFVLPGTLPVGAFVKLLSHISGANEW